MATRRPLLVALCLWVLAAACSSEPAAITSTLPSTNAASSSAPVPESVATTAAPPTTPPATQAPATSPPTTEAPVFDTVVGNVDDLNELVASIVAAITPSTPELAEATIPIPDLTNPDPIVALSEIRAWAQWVAANFPDERWADVGFAPTSPSHFEAVRDGSVLNNRDQLRVRPNAAYVIGATRVVDLTTFDLPQQFIDGLPNNAVGILYENSSGPLHRVSAEDGSLIDEVSEGWDQISLIILVPTGVGWREWDTVSDVGGDI